MTLYQSAGMAEGGVYYLPLLSTARPEHRPGIEPGPGPVSYQGPGSVTRSAGGRVPAAIPGGGGVKTRRTTWL